MRSVLLLTLLVLAAPIKAPVHAGDITVYRCTDAAGRVSLRDTPCPQGQRQSTREMLRPKDPPPSATPASRARSWFAMPAVK